MKASKFSEAQIAFVLKQAEDGAPIGEVCRKAIETPVSFIVHSRREVNNYLKEGQYFFSDIRKEGIVLYELDEEPLAEPKLLSAADLFQTCGRAFRPKIPGGHALSPNGNASD